MNGGMLASERKKKGYSLKEMAEVLEISYDAYRRRERGEVAFTKSEVAKVVTTLEMPFPKFNAIFYDGMLPTCIMMMPKRYRTVSTAV